MEVCSMLRHDFFALGLSEMHGQPLAVIPDFTVVQMVPAVDPHGKCGV